MNKSLPQRGSRTAAHNRNKKTDSDTVTKTRPRPVRRASVRGQPENRIASMPKRKTK